MDIYIYGNSGFKKEIHATLDHANIKFKLDDNTIIKDINTLEELKDTIKNNPDNIYLIDDEKIIKKNSKIKFLTPKDGIEETFLLDNGIPDVSVDSFSDIPKYIIRKHDEQKSLDEDIQNSIIDIVDEAYESDTKSSKSEKNIDDDIDVFDTENIELDDELSMLLSKEEDKKELDDLDLDINLDDLDDILKDDSIKEDDLEDTLNDEEFSKLMNFDEDVGLENTSSDYDSDENIVSEDDKKEKVEDLENHSVQAQENEIDDLDDFLQDLSSEDLPNFDTIDEDENSEIKTEIQEEISEPSKGDNMASEFSELDALSESDVLDALSNLDDTSSSTTAVSKASSVEEKIELQSSNINEISTLITQLLKNKTLEITIKIKD